MLRRHGLHHRQVRHRFGRNLAYLIGVFYFTSFLFVVVVLGAVCRYNGFSVFALIRYIKEELLLVLGTSSSEAALPSLMKKMENAGAKKSVVGLVIPTGYSFNLDGTKHLHDAGGALHRPGDQHRPVLGRSDSVAPRRHALVERRGRHHGGGLHHARRDALGRALRAVAGMALILGVDRFMSECRAITNFIGNAVATLVVARWEGELDQDRLRAVLAG